MSSPLTDEALAELEAKACEATRGPWGLGEDAFGFHRVIDNRGNGITPWTKDPNNFFIAAANPETVLALVEEVQDGRTSIRAQTDIIRRQRLEIEQLEYRILLLSGLRGEP